jgi:hypothetical protein
MWAQKFIDLVQHLADPQIGRLGNRRREITPEPSQHFLVVALAGRNIVELAFQAFEMFPLVVKVLVLEFGRNARLGETLESPAVAQVFGSIARIFDEGRRSGELYEGIDPLAMSVIFMGTLETAFVSFVLTNSGARSKLQSGITLDKMKSTLLAMIKRALIGSIKQKTN